MIRPICRFIALLVCLSVGLATAAESPAQAPVQGEGVVELDLATFDIIPPKERWEFNPTTDRRDIFYDLEKIYEGKVELVKLAQEQDAATIVEEPGIERLPEGATLEDSLERAQSILASVQQAMAGQQWDVALRKSQNGIKLLKAMLNDFEDNQKLHQVIDKLARYEQLAEEAKLLEQAKQEFAKLELLVEGIMWSADERSLAIISGETFAAQDRVKNTLIVNIDVNRVDFMFTFKGRRFEFQRYIGE